MNKIPTCFERDWDGDRSRVLDVVHPGCEWVFAGEGVATRKYDGTCVMFDGQDWWSRREVKEGKDDPPSFQFVSFDPETGKRVGWEPIEQSPFARFFFDTVAGGEWEVGTYELCGPKVNKNPEGLERHELIFHARVEQAEVERTFEAIRVKIAELRWEGFVFHHPDGRMAKIKGRDFGIRR